MIRQKNEYDKLVLTDEAKEKLNLMLDKNKQVVNNNLDVYKDFDYAMETLCADEFYHITRDVMDSLHKHVDFYKDDVTAIYEAFADDRDILWNKIRKNGYRV